VTTPPTKPPVHLAETVITAFNAADWEQLRGVVAPNLVYTETGTQRRVETLDDYLQLLQGWKQALPDARGTIHKAVSQGNTAVQEVIWEGTQTGPLPTPPVHCRHRGRRSASRLPSGIPLRVSWCKKFTTILMCWPCCSNSARCRGKKLPCPVGTLAFRLR